VVSSKIFQTGREQSAATKKNKFATKGKTMKRTLLLSFLLIFVFSYPQKILRNPKKPLSKNPGRVLKLVEVMRINGEGDGYYYSGANKLKIDNSGNIYISDFWSSRTRSHFLKFSPDGKFLKDLYKQGEGPGEIQSGFDFAFTESEIYVYDNMKRKIIVIDKDGKFITEFKTKSESFNAFIGIFKDWLVFLRKDYPFERKTSRLYNVKNVIVFVSKDGQIEKDFYTFSNKEFYISLAQGGGSMSWDPFILVKGNDKLFVCSSREYLIEVLDLESGKIISRFRRKYPHVKHIKQKWEETFISKYNAPKKKFDSDIEDLLYDRDFLWIKTSTKDELKGYLYDFYDSEGRFLDSFYIKARLVRIDSNYLYTSEYDQNHLPYVVKYKIETFD